MRDVRPAGIESESEYPTADDEPEMPVSPTGSTQTPIDARYKKAHFKESKSAVVLAEYEQEYGEAGAPGPHVPQPCHIQDDDTDS